MKILIVFDDHYGLVERSARTLAEYLRRAAQQIDLIDLESVTPHVLQHYNVVVAVGAMLHHQLDENLALFLQQNTQELIIKPLYLVLHSNAEGEEFLRAAAANIQPKVLQHTHSFNVGFDFSTIIPSLPTRLAFGFRKLVTGKEPEYASNYDWEQLSTISDIIVQKRVGKLF